MCVYTHVSLSLSLSLPLSLPLSLFIYLSIYIYIYIHTYVYVYIYIYIYTCVQLALLMNARFAMLVMSRRLRQVFELLTWIDRQGSWTLDC